MIHKYFFRLGFIIMSCFALLEVALVFTVLYLDNPLMLSYHPDFYIGILFGIAYFGTIYLGWLKHE